MKTNVIMFTGGRVLPEFLVIKYLRPAMTFNITTKQGIGSAEYLKNLVFNEFGCSVTVMPPLNPYKEQDIKVALLNLLHSEADVEWIITITSAPKTMSIYAMDVARAENIPCWFLNTDEGELISLSKDIPVDNDLLFDITVEQYMKAYERVYEIPGSENYRKKAEGWYSIARVLAHNSEPTHKLLSALRLAQHRKPEEMPVTFTLPADVAMKALVQELSNLGALTIDSQTSMDLQCTVAGGDMRKFLGGAWLEVYVWQEIVKAGFAKDCQWGYEVHNKQARNELDVAFTYNGLFFIAECKTDKDPFTEKRQIYLDTLSSVAGILGRDFVGRFFVTNHPDPEIVTSFASFREQAMQRKICIISGKDLPSIGTILTQLAKNPFFERV